MDRLFNQLNLIFKDKYSEKRIIKIMICYGYLYFNSEGKLKDFAQVELQGVSEIKFDQLKEFFDINLKDLNKYIDFILYLLSKYNYYKSVSIQPYLLNHLIFNLLDYKTAKRIFFLSTTYCDFLAHYFLYYSNKDFEFCSVTDNINIVDIYRYLIDLLSINCRLRNYDPLGVSFNDFDSAFVIPSYKKKELDNYDFKNIFGLETKFNSRTTPEWFYVEKIVNDIKENNMKNKVVALMSSKALFSHSDTDYRNYLLDRKLLEGIIELPKWLFDSSMPKMSLLIFSNNNSNIKIIDGNEIEDCSLNGINELLDVYEENKCIVMDAEEIKKKNTFEVATLLTKPVTHKHGKLLKEIANVNPGSQYTLTNFKGYITEQRTKCRLLTPSDIENGTFNFGKLHSIYDYEKFNKHYAQNGDIIITAKSPTTKIAFIEDIGDKKIVITGGMFIIRPNKELVNPLYLKMYLESSDGMNTLESLKKGKTIPAISVDALANIDILLPPIEIQNKIAYEYEEKIRKITKLKKELSSLESELRESTVELFYNLSTNY